MCSHRSVELALEVGYIAFQQADLFAEAFSIDSKPKSERDGRGVFEVSAARLNNTGVFDSKPDEFPLDIFQDRDHLVEHDVANARNVCVVDNVTRRRKLVQIAPHPFRYVLHDLYDQRTHIMLGAFEAAFLAILL